MDLATLIGVILAFVCLALGITLEGGDLTKYVAPSAFIIVVPSTFGAAMAAGYLKDIKLVIQGAKGAFMTKNHEGGEAIELMVKFAEKARREGLLALEEAVRDV